MITLLRSWLVLLLLVGCVAVRPAAAQSYEEPSGRDIVVAYNTGFRFALFPGVIIPRDGGKVGFSVAGDIRYGFEAGPVILAPGLRVGGYFPPDYNAFVGVGTLRVTVPLGPVGPYVLGGLGPGYVSDPSHTGLAYLAGGGFMVHIGTRFGIGAEASYLAITGSDFGALFIGPTLLFGF